MIKRLSEGIKKIHNNEHGQGMAEYGLIIALVAVLAIAGFQLLGRSLGSKIEGVADTIQNSK
ncbi:MAG: Flp family type IVb pilin [Desulfocucumaceae bacterium]